MIQFFSQGVAKTVVAPRAAKDPALFLGLLYNAYGHLDAMHDRPASATALEIKSEAIRQINNKISNPVTAASGEAIAAVATLASGSNVRICSNHYHCSRLPL